MRDGRGQGEEGKGGWEGRPAGVRVGIGELGEERPHVTRRTGRCSSRGSAQQAPALPRGGRGAGRVSRGVYMPERGRRVLFPTPAGEEQSLLRRFAAQDPTCPSDPFRD